jgi:hypothetical protein
VLDDPGPRAAATRVAENFARGGGAPAAAALLERLADEAVDEADTQDPDTAAHSITGTTYTASPDEGEHA